MTDLALDPVTRRFVRDAQGVPRLTKTLAEQVRQQIDIRFRLFRGEWFEDTRIGFPWFETILGAKLSQAVVSAEIKLTVIGVPGVASIGAITFTRDTARRSVRIAFSTTLTDGSNLPVDQEFIIP